MTIWSKLFKTEDEEQRKRINLDIQKLSQEFEQEIASVHQLSDLERKKGDRM